MPPQSPTDSSSLQVSPSSSETARRTGCSPEKITSRGFPPGSTMRWIVGVSCEVAQLCGTRSRSLQVRPPSVLRFSTMAPWPCPLG